MKLLTKISWRNIIRHKGKSLVIGIILFTGALIMTVGNGIITGMDNGLRENIMNRFTGQIVVVSKHQEDNSILFGSMGPMSDEVKVIPDFRAVKTVLDKQDYITNYIPLCKGWTTLLNENGDMGFALLIGADFTKYQEMFNNNVKLVEGGFLEKNERGVLITEGIRKQIFKQQDYWIKPKGFPFNAGFLTDEAKMENDSNKLILRDDIIIMGSGGSGFFMDIRANVKGIIKYEFLDNYWNAFNIIDIESFREAFNYVTSTDADVVLSDDKKKIIASDNLDEMFGDSLLVEAGTVKKEYNAKTLVARDKSKEKPVNDSATYNMIFVKIKNTSSSAIENSVKKLNSSFTESNTEARAISWKEASGQLGQMASLIRIALYVFVFLIFFVAIIVIMNTLSMTAMERVTEIGMMRAVGAQRSFIERMFFIESASLSFVFGGAGIIAGIVLTVVLNSLNITTDNSILQLLFGGSVFKPFIGIFDVLTGIIELGLVTVIATLYPIRIASRITPLDAIARD